MSKTHSLKYQIRLATFLKNDLIQFNKSLEVASEECRYYINRLHAEGMEEEFHNKFKENYINPTLNIISALTESINKHDIPMINGYIGDLEDGLRY